MAATYAQTFSSAGTWHVPGLTHDLGSEDLVFAVYDSGNPRVWVAPGSATVHPSTFDFATSFVPGFAGLLVLVEGDYAETFSASTSWTLPGVTHGLGTKALIPMCWDTATPRQWIIPQGLTVHPTSFTVVVTWGLATAGTLVLVEAQYLEAFTTATSVTATGVEHGRGTQGLLTAVYNDATPALWIGSGAVNVYQSTFDVVMMVSPALSGSLLVHGEVSGGGGASGRRRISRCGQWYQRS